MHRVGLSRHGGGRDDDSPEQNVTANPNALSHDCVISQKEKLDIFGGNE
jgi:hypothetical protein